MSNVTGPSSEPLRPDLEALSGPETTPEGDELLA